MFSKAVLVFACAGIALATEFNPLHHSGPASPYFDAPTPEHVPEATPEGCIVDQAAYIVRHGSRFPEPGSFGGWKSLFQKIQNATFTARGPLAFLPSWVPPVDDAPHEPLFLTSHGAQEAFELGAQLRQEYGFTHGGKNFTVWAAGQQRVVDTATYFMRGYLSQGNYIGLSNENQGTVVILPDSVNYTSANSLTPSAACPKYSSGVNSTVVDNFHASYRSGIAKRLNEFLHGLVLDANDVGVMGDLCGFQAALNGDTRFCNIFKDEEMLDYEYAWDLNYYYGSGPGNPFAGATGLPWVKAVAELFGSGPNVTPANSTFAPPPLLMGFTHDNNLPPVLAALGLWNDSHTSPLSLTRPDPRRTFRSSNVVSFRGYIALERLSCEKPLSESVFHKAGVLNEVPGNSTKAAKYVRVRVSAAPIPIPGCTSGPGESCPLNSFLSHVAKREGIVGDFVKTCGLQGVKNATSVASFFTDIPKASLIGVVSADNLPQLTS
ncbi:phosphoglycerate mutase-like protein [Vararia minispora EC-137]|uniref:Phosphoglycerate mutase-like protein n=1 Tax=Vararia minispora EC-137 TaxID=1314806 RepID=A0ACB8QU27_9AGAM|nr:phosphoglycerate mutase-like protein [Vararia minispora EC-137]